MAKDNKAVLRDYWEQVWNHRHVDKLWDYGTEDLVLHIGGAALPGKIVGDALASQWFDPFPDLHVTVELQLAEGDLVAEWLTFRGTHSGIDFLPGMFRALGLPPIPARGNSFEFTQTSICRMEDGRIAEIWEDFDRVRLFMQLGVELIVP